jgi:hypothetical protein
MEKGPFKLIAVLIVLTGLTSCYSVSTYYISVLHPAEITLPPGIRNVSICPGTKARHPGKGKLDSLDNIRLNQDIYYYDHCKEYLNGLAEILAYSPRFDKVVVRDSVPAPDSEADSLSWSDIIGICRVDSTDALVALEYFYLTDIFDINNFFDLGCTIVYSIINYSAWKIYNPRDFNIADDYILRDTLYWERYDFYCDNALRKFPESTAIIDESFYMAGNKYGLRMAPLWDDNIERKYYSSGNKRLRDAAMHVKRNQWSEAIELWRSLSGHPNKILASKACHNMALACETEDKPELALEWAKKSYSLYRNPASAAYIKILAGRIKDKEKLDSQMLNN